jgi:hypothetical protein
MRWLSLLLLLGLLALQRADAGMIIGGGGGSAGCQFQVHGVSGTDMIEINGVSGTDMITGNC